MRPTLAAPLSKQDGARALNNASISPLASMSDKVRYSGTAAPPFDVARLDAVFVLENAPDPDIRGHRIIGHPDRSALEILRSFDAAIGTNIDATVAEQPRQKDRNGDVMRVAASRCGHVVAQ